MSKPAFLLSRLLKSVQEEDDYITKEVIESNPNNSHLNLEFQIIEIPKMESIYLYDKRIEEKQIGELRRLNKYVIDKRTNNLEEEIHKIESNFSFKILKKSYSRGNIELKGKSKILTFFPSLPKKETEKSNFDIINYSYQLKMEGFYEETVSYKNDLMIAEFYDAQFPNCVGKKEEFLKIAQYVKPKFKEYFKTDFLDKFEERKTFFHWDH